MTQDNTPTTPTETTSTPAAPARRSYTDTVIDAIKASPVYVGDGGFLAQAMEADSLEEATATSELWSAQDEIGTVFHWLGAKFLDSDLDGTLPFFAICDVVNTQTGEKGQLSVGGARVVATLFRACEANWYPFDASLATVDVGTGKTAMNLVVAPKKVENTKKS